MDGLPRTHQGSCPWPCLRRVGSFPDSQPALPRAPGAQGAGTPHCCAQPAQEEPEGWAEPAAGTAAARELISNARSTWERQGEREPALRKSLSQPSPAQPLPGSSRAGQWPSGPGQQGMDTWQERCPSCLVLLCRPSRALRAPSPRAEGCAGWEGTPELCCSGQCLPCRAGPAGATSALQQGFPQHCLPPSLPMLCCWSCPSPSCSCGPGLLPCQSCQSPAQPLGQLCRAAARACRD